MTWSHKRTASTHSNQGGIPTTPAVSHRRRANVLGVGVDALDLEGALERVREVLELGKRGYVCAVGVHGVLAALRDKRMARALADACIVIPDGTPTVWVGRLQRCEQMGHVPGPTLMQEIFRRKDFANLTHYLYGGKEGVAGELARNLASKYPHARIVGIHTPPFRALTAAEEDALIGEIDRLKPDIFWVGISTPKQELFMRSMSQRLRTRLMFGVGAAFDFHTGRIRDCAPWIKAAGFQWLHRLVQDPKRLWRRNLNNSTFLWHIALQLSGVKTVPLTTSSRDLHAISGGQDDSTQFDPSSAINT